MDATRELFVRVAQTHGIDGVDFSAPSSHFLAIDGVRFHYLDWGGTRPAIFFVHGGGQSAYTWDFVNVQLRGRYHCLAMDLRDHGQTDKAPGPFSYRDHAKDIGAMIEALGLNDFVLVAMSLGGLASMPYAAGHPKGLQALTLVDITPNIHQEQRQETYRFRATQEFATFEEAVDQAVLMNPGRPRVHMEYSLSHSLAQLADGKWAWRNRPRIRPDSPEARAARVAAAADLWSEPAKILCPTLVVHGQLSNVTYREDAVKLGKELARSRVVTIPNATHTVQGDQPKALAQELLRFLKDVA